MHAVPLHPSLGVLAFLVGTWTGRGVGDYPTIDRFGYRKAASFAHVGKPYLSYSQRTWSTDGDAPLHSETGYWRPAPDDHVEIVVAHPFGVVEVAEGSLRRQQISLTSTTLSATSTGANIAGIARTLWVEGNTLRYWVDIAASGQPLQRHLEAELRRTG